MSQNHLLFLALGLSCFTLAQGEALADFLDFATPCSITFLYEWYEPSCHVFKNTILGAVGVLIMFMAVFAHLLKIEDGHH